MVDYDYLVVALGATVNTFNTPGVMENCYFLKVKILNDIQLFCYVSYSNPRLSSKN